MQKRNQSKNGFNMEGVGHKLYTKDELEDCPLAYDSVMKHVDLNFLCRGPI